MSIPLILDASALIAVAKGEPGQVMVKDLIESSFDITMHIANVFEVVYKLMLWGVDADSAWNFVDIDDVSIVGDVDEPFVRKAALLKYGHPFLSMADCFCIALAEDLHGQILTSDRVFSKVRTSADVVIFR